jgi:hypothetical protein
MSVSTQSTAVTTLAAGLVALLGLYVVSVTSTIASHHLGMRVCFARTAALDALYR